MGKILRQPLRLIPAGTHLPILQGRLRGKRWIAGSSIHGCWLGSYEVEKQKLFEAEVKAGSVVFDVGANVGFYTLLASVLVGPSGKVFAFEPLPRNIQLLHEHLHLNRITNATIIEKAVSDTNGTASFSDSLENSMGHLDVSGSRTVRTITIDNFVSEGNAPPSCIKIDVEGSETFVLAGARSVIEKNRPKIFLATHGATQHRDCCEFLRGMNYELVTIGGESLAESDEIFAYSS